MFGDSRETTLDLLKRLLEVPDQHATGLVREVMEELASCCHGDRLNHGERAFGVARRCNEGMDRSAEVYTSVEPLAARDGLRRPQDSRLKGKRHVGAFETGAHCIGT